MRVIESEIKIKILLVELNYYIKVEFETDGILYYRGYHGYTGYPSPTKEEILIAKRFAEKFLRRKNGQREFDFDPLRRRQAEFVFN